MNTSHREDEMRIAERAAEWLDDVAQDDGRRTAFFEWLRVSPRHAEETLFVLALSKEASLLPNDQDEMPIAPAAVVPSMARPVAPRPVHARSRWKMAAGIAACLAVAGIAGFWAVSQTSVKQQYLTGIGEQRTLALADGSLVQMNTKSRVEVRFDARARELRLVDGEALFTVARDAARPFRVRTSDAVIEALGTQFNVYHRTGDTRVAVIEGLVQVAAARLPAGQQMSIENGRIASQSTLDVAKTTAWRQRRLVFEDDTLADIAAEFNRYNERIPIEISAEAARQRFTGTFDADAPETFMLALAANPTLRIERHKDGIRVSERP